MVQAELTRRRFLAGAGALAAGGALSLSGASRALGLRALRTPGSLPNPALPAGTDTLPQIQHIVVLMMENHSWDNLFGMLGRGDGFRLDRNGRPVATNPYPDGRIQHAFHMPTTCQLPGRPSNEWTASHVAWNNGRMDGFVRTPISPATTEIVGGVAMGYWTAADLPFTYGLARAFAVGDRWFASTLAQTDPNRRYLIAGTSSGMTGDVGTGPGNAIPDLGLGVPANGTIFDQLELHGISWANYAASYPTGATPELYPANDGAYESQRVHSFEQFFADAHAGSLPAFTLLDPDYSTQSQENPQNIVVGEAMLARVVDALGSSPL
ncbi:MAG TPA: alkaline phosphatase family protein, partial [Acidimicrobiales bacterium]|nr:alkaline phosphatase family protein [Acidimicrobiales bacterium]